MLTGDAYASGHLVPSHFGLDMFYLLRPILFPTLSLFSDYALRSSFGNFSILLWYGTSNGSMGQWGISAKTQLAPLPSWCFWSDRKTSMTALASDRLIHFGPPLCNKQNLTKLDRRQNLSILILYHFVCWSKSPWSDWHFRLLICNHWTEFDETWQDAIS